MKVAIVRVYLLAVVAAACSACAKAPWYLVAVVKIPDFPLTTSDPIMTFGVSVDYSEESFPSGENVGVALWVHIMSTHFGWQPHSIRTSLVSLDGTVLNAHTLSVAPAGGPAASYQAEDFVSLVLDGSVADPCRDRHECTLNLNLVFEFQSGNQASVTADVEARVSGDKEGDPPDDARVTLSVVRAADGSLVGKNTFPEGCAAAPCNPVAVLLLALILARSRVGR